MPTERIPIGIRSVGILGVCRDDDDDDGGDDGDDGGGTFDADHLAKGQGEARTCKRQPN